MDNDSYVVGAGVKNKLNATIVMNVLQAFALLWIIVWALRSFTTYGELPDSYFFIIAGWLVLSFLCMFEKHIFIKKQRGFYEEKLKYWQEQREFDEKVMNANFSVCIYGEDDEHDKG
jgi:hypothetical protein